MESLSAGPSIILGDAEILAMVHEKPAPDGEGTVVAWVERELGSPHGQSLFPRWTVQRRASSRYEVRFTYTWVAPGNRIENRGYRWQVDASLRTVQGPDKLESEESPRARSLADQQQRRVEDPEYNLY